MNQNKISVSELKDWISSNKDFQLIDVREENEHDVFNIGGELIPLTDVIQHMGKIEQYKPVILYCRIGVRSQIAIQKLQQKMPFHNLLNLEGGVEAWRQSFPESSQESN